MLPKSKKILQVYDNSLFTGKNIDQFSWLAFISPFHWTIWLCLFASIIVLSAALWFFHGYQRKYKTLGIIEAFCISTSSIFGMGIWDAHQFHSNESGRLTLLIVFISGSVFFYTYGGFLTSSLAVPMENIPFSSPQEILSTNYRYWIYKFITKFIINCTGPHW